MISVAMKVLKLFLAALSSLCSGCPHRHRRRYSLVQGIDRFEGSATAWRLLETNGFVVADPVYNQIFEPHLTRHSLLHHDGFGLGHLSGNSRVGHQATRIKKANEARTVFTDKHREFQNQWPNRIRAGFFSWCVSRTAFLSRCALHCAKSPESRQNRSRKIFHYSTLPSNPLASEIAPIARSPPTARLGPSRAGVPLRRLGGGAAFGRNSAHGSSNLATANFIQRRTRRHGIFKTSPSSAPSRPIPNSFPASPDCPVKHRPQWKKADLDEPFDTKALAQKMLNDIFIQQGLVVNEGQGATLIAEPQTQFQQFAGHYSEKHHTGGGENSPAAQQLLKNLEAVARQCLAGTIPSEADQAILQGFYDERRTPPRLLRDFAATCDKLADLAGKQANATPFSDEDRDWIANYGATLAQFHSGPADESRGASEDFPTTRPLATNFDGASVLCAGLGQPETLYIILRAEGRLHLFRGAVLSYRECLRTNSPAQESEPGRDSQAPTFTASFRAEKSPTEILDSLASGVSDRYRISATSSKTSRRLIRASPMPALARAHRGIGKIRLPGRARRLRRELAPPLPA